MIDDPPLLTIRRKFARPDRVLVDALAGTPTGFLVDAMGGHGALDARIKAVPGTPGRFIGTALTCANGPADNLALAAAVCLSEPGDVLVAATEGHVGCAVMGDLLLGMAKNRGVAAFVTDGMVDASPVVVGDRVYVGCLSGEGQFYALDLKTGKKLQQLNLDSAVTGSAAVGPDCLLVGTEKGTLYCLGSK